MLPTSSDVINKDFQTKAYRTWANRIGVNHNVYHAKFWEQAMIFSALKKYGQLMPGKKGLGFGVGREQLVSVFANEGVSVTATDQAPTNTSMAWDNGQLAHGKASLFYKELIDKKLFNENVIFEHHDMNTYEKRWKDKYDFTWSNCVVGHLGSMALSEKYLIRHSKYLRYGGVSVLTTELNISSLTETVSENSGTIVWRLDDLYRVFSTMLDHDMVAERFKLRLVKDKTDRYIYFDIDDVTESFFQDKLTANIYMTKIPFSNYAITPIQIVFKKRKISNTEKSIRRKMLNNDLSVNRRRLKNFLNSGGDISDYLTTYSTSDLNIKPLQKSKKVRIQQGKATEITLRFKNSSNQNLFSYGNHTPLNIPPLVLATANPVNRSSEFNDKSWFGDNRPSVSFTPIFKKSNFESICHGMHRSLPGETFTYTLTLKAPRKIGKYNESFCLVLEGKGEVAQSYVKLQIDVVE